MTRIDQSTATFTAALAAMAVGTYTDRDYRRDHTVLADNTTRVPAGLRLARMYRSTLAAAYRTYREAGALDLDALLARGPQ